MTPLPIDIVLPELRSVLRTQRNAVLSAEPGAGKTTRVPLALREEEWLGSKKIIMLEPRRLAAIRSAHYMAEQAGEKAGESIGYRIRGESAVSSKTTIEVVTEGILTRMIQDDMSLPGVGLIIFDEFHERSIHADLGLALALNVQEHLRNDLKILVMSATLDGAAVSSLLGNAPVISSAGRMFPVTTHYLDRERDRFPEPAAANAVVKALRENEGDILVFLPGQKEIHKTSALLEEKEISSSVVTHLLFGEMSFDRQKRALQPDPSGKRKVILSTNVAETSVTINGVAVVIDAGLSRISQFDPRRGMSGLVTVPVSRASADQRKGRAGRERPGVCYRLWTEAQHHQLPPFSSPEILITDLAPLALEFAMWGDGEGKELKFLDPPPNAHLRQARNLLRQLGALDAAGNLTPHGKKIASLPVHPRFGHMIVTAKEKFGPDGADTACTLAALLENRDIVRGKSDADIDLRSRFDAFKRGDVTDRNGAQRIADQAERLKKIVGIPAERDRKKSSHRSEILGTLLALAYPERIAKRKSGGKYQLSGNTIAVLPPQSGLFTEEYLAVGEADGAGGEVKIFLAEPVTEEELRSVFADLIETTDEITWNEKEKSVLGRKITRLGALELAEKIFTPTAEQSLPLILQYIRNNGLAVLPWDKETELFRQRSEWLRKRSLVTETVDLSDERLLSTLEVWLAPFLTNVTRAAHLSRLSMGEIIRSMFTHKQLQEIQRLAPTHHTVPTGSSIPIEYSGETPVLAVRLQEMFGETETPSVAGGKVKVLLHLLSPARRPLAVTQDLPSFWKNAYIQVRKDMRGDYPKHYWPDNPLEAEPTKRTKKFMEKKN